MIQGIQLSDKTGQNTPLGFPSVGISLGLGLASLIGLWLNRPQMGSLGVEAEDALVAFAWLGGLALALWWTLSLAICLVVEHSHSDFLRHLSHRISMPIVRRMVQGSLALGLVALPACANQQGDRPEMALVESGVGTTTLGIEVPMTTTDSVTTPPTMPSKAPPTTEIVGQPNEDFPGGQDGEADRTPAAEPTAEPTKPNHTVAAGENLWTIAKSRLQVSGTPNPTTAQIGSYWVDMIEVNRESLSSGNPNLIYPGEVLRMPAV